MIHEGIRIVDATKPRSTCHSIASLCFSSKKQTKQLQEVLHLQERFRVRARTHNSQDCGVTSQNPPPIAGELLLDSTKLPMRPRTRCCPIEAVHTSSFPGAHHIMLSSQSHVDKMYFLQLKHPV